MSLQDKVNELQNTMDELQEILERHHNIEDALTELLEILEEQGLSELVNQFLFKTKTGSKISLKDLVKWEHAQYTKI